MPEKKDNAGPNVTTRLFKNKTSLERSNLSSINKKKPIQSKSFGKFKSRRQHHEVAKSRHSKKIEHRKREKRTFTAREWAIPAPSNLVAKLDAPKVKTKYQSYFEFAENPDKKEKRLEFKVIVMLRNTLLLC